MVQTDCRHFSGYKPCDKNEICDERCPHLSRPQIHILFIHLEALGAVLRSTALLRAIKRKFPSSHITWVTSTRALDLLRPNRLIDRLLCISTIDLLKLQSLEFDISFVIDKSLEAGGILKSVKTDLVYGFIVDPRTGSVMPATEAARELWEVGLDDQKKFFGNQKPETQLLAEALELLPFHRDEYVVELTPGELQEVRFRKKSWAREGDLVIGINTGCSATIPYKKLSVEFHREVIQALKGCGYKSIVLLGGPEDTPRNQAIAFGTGVIESPTDSGIRDGLVSVAACDMVITGDSLGLHLAIALQKWVIAWFGPTCPQEIDLFDRGIKIRTRAPCAPCWRRSCQNDPMCYDQVALAEILQGVEQGKQWILQNRKNQTNSKTLSSKQLLLETRF